MKMVKIKIKKRWYYGEVVSEDDEVLYNKKLIRYKMEDGTHTTGWFNVCDIFSVTDFANVCNENRVTDNYRIKCIKCAYTVVIEKKKEYGYCPVCMGKKFIELEYVGTY